MKITLKWLEKSTDGAVAYTPGNVAMAKAILKEGWSARAAERGLSAPADLSGACKFASLFVKLCFGGCIEGNELHQYNLIQGEMVDLTEQHEFDGLPADPCFFGNPDHLESLQSCLPRVERWVTLLKAQIQP